MTDRLSGRRIAVFVEQEFSARELLEPVRLLKAEGASVTIIGPTTKSPYRDKTGTETVTADLAAGACRMKDYDAILIPGGHAPDRMRMRHAMIDMITDAVAAGKPVAAICHGPQVLITANVLRGRTVTCWPSIAVDVTNAGGRYVDRPMVRDGSIITARKSDDLPYFIEALVEALQPESPAAPR